MHFANPHGLYALLALPVIVIIHCLQERSRRVRASTLFLLETVAPESVTGARLERWRQSLPFWMQIIAALLITWMLAQPRWLKQDSTQTIAVVLDSSASMSAFNAELKTELKRALGPWSQNAVHTRWHVIETDPRKPTLYAGPHLDELLLSLDHFHPVKGSHDTSDAFNTARSLVRGTDSVIIFVSDHKAEIPSDIALLAVGASKDNVGWSALTVEAPFTWKALLINHSDHEQTREWWIEHDQQPKPTHTQVVLQPRQTLSIKGELPDATEKATLVCSGDAFPLDDRAPMRRPIQIPVCIAMKSGSDSSKQLREMLSALDGVTFTSAGEGANLTIADIGDDSASDAIFIDTPAADSAKLDASIVCAENHSLTRDLNWMGLLCTHPRALTLLDSDEPLLWRGDEPLAFLRHSRTEDGKAVRQLFLNWDLHQSNAARLPAMLLMLHRYVEQTRQQLIATRSENVETGQFLTLPGAVNDKPLSLRRDATTSPFTGSAPDEPGFFEIYRDAQALIQGAATFADAREADLSSCESIDGTTTRRTEAALRQTEADPLTPLWLLLMLGCLLAAWGSKPSR